MSSMAPSTNNTNEGGKADGHRRARALFLLPRAAPPRRRVWHAAKAGGPARHGVPPD
ncbi:hypothetical protein HMPREF1868_02091 [Olsenella sp. DNF00959]|nr:hypothetical protein HMPREF1868_02091 [Olsenella sp. DNF00959]